MRNIVDKPDCNICPLNKFPDYKRLFDPSDPFFGVFEWQSRYMTASVKKGEKPNNVLLFNGVILPKRKAMSNENEEPSTKFIGDLQLESGTINDLVFDLKRMNKPDDFNRFIVETVGNANPVHFSGSRRHLSGVLQLLNLRLKKSDVYLSAGKCQGPYKFKTNDGEEGWYWVDSKGCRDSSWEESSNVVILDEKFQGIFGEPIQSLTNLPRLKDLPFSLPKTTNLLQSFNGPEVVYPFFGWVVASFFRIRFVELQKKHSVEHMRNFPVCFFSGSSGMGKSQTVANIFKPLCGYPEGETEIADISFHAIRSNFLLLSRGAPLFLDELKMELLSHTKKSAKMTINDVKGLIRSAWSGSAMQRGLPSGGKVDSFPFDCALCLIGESVPEGFDEAMQHRCLFVKGDPNISRSYEKNYKRLIQKGQQIKKFLSVLGATIAYLSLSISDEKLLEWYLKIEERVEELVSIPDRRKYGLIKILFGNYIMKRILVEWDYRQATISCFKAYSIDLRNKKANVKAGISQTADDWSLIMNEYMELTNVDILAVNRLVAGTGYFFDDKDPKISCIFWLNLGKARKCLLAECRRQGTTLPSISLEEFIEIGKNKGFILPFKNGSYFAPDVNFLRQGKAIKGPWLKLNMDKMRKPDNPKQISFRFSSIPGSDMYCKNEEGVYAGEI